MIGTVKKAVTDKGYAFLLGEDGQDYFCHYSALQGCTINDMKLGQTVQFQVGDSPKGPRAEQVSLVIKEGNHV